MMKLPGSNDGRARRGVCCAVAAHDEALFVKSWSDVTAVASDVRTLLRRGTSRHGEGKSFLEGDQCFF